MRCAPARPVRACFVRTCCAVVVQGHDLRAAAAPIQREATSFFTLQSARFTPRTSHFTLALHTPHFISSHVMWALLTSSHLISSLLISSHLSRLFSSHPSTDQPFSSPRSSSQLISAVLHARKLLTVRVKSLAPKETSAESFCTQKLETQMHLHRKAFAKYFVPQSLHKALPITTLYYKACTMYVPVRLCTTKLAQSTSQYYFVLQSLHKALPSTTLYYKACTKHVPALLCTTQLAQNTFFIAGCSHFTPKNAQFRAFLRKKKQRATLMQPLQCVSQPQLPKHHVTAMCRNTRNTSKQPLHCGLLQDLAEPSPHPPHTRGTFHRRLQPPTRKDTRFRSPASSPTQVPCNSLAAIIIITSIHHHFSSSPLPFVTASLGPHFQKSLHHPAWMYCFVM